VDLCLGPYVGPRWWAFSYERGTPVIAMMATRILTRARNSELREFISSRVFLSESVYKVVLQKSILAQIRQRVLYYY
jgi:hypothetical protein